MCMHENRPGNRTDVTARPWTSLPITPIHTQIPLTGYVGLILGSTAVATASRSTVEGTMRVL